MKLTVALLLFCIAGTVVAEEETTYRLYYLGGQSNMDGFGWNKELPSDYREAHPEVMIFRGLSAADNDPQGGVGRWDRLRPGFGLGFETDGEQQSYSDRFGAELTFGHRMAALHPEDNIAIVKYSRGGTPLYLHGSGYGTWNPDIEGSNQYDFALRAIDGALDVDDIDGDGIRDRLVPTGIVWMQGEADAFDSKEAAAVYQDNLRRTMDLIRAALRVDDLPVVIGQITDSGRADDGRVMDWSDEVREAQRQYTEADACASLVTVTNELAYPDDDEWHYDSEGYLRLGAAFADAVTELQTDCER